MAANSQQSKLPRGRRGTMNIYLRKLEEKLNCLDFLFFFELIYFKHSANIVNPRSAVVFDESFLIEHAY